MTRSDELAIDNHILAKSNLKPSSIGYKALASLLKYGNFLSYGFRTYEIFVDFTRLLNQLQLEFTFIPFGLQLKDDAKSIYYANMMIRKYPEEKPTYDQSGVNRVGKEERADTGGWIRTQNLKND